MNAIKLTQPNIFMSYNLTELRAGIKWTTGLVAAAVLLTTLISYQQLSASEVVELRPAIMELQAEHGTAEEGSLRVTNAGEQTNTFYPMIRDIVGVRAGGAPSFDPEPVQDNGMTLAGWIEVQQESLTLEPGETGEFNFVVDVPENAGPGGHYAGFFVTRQPPEIRRTGAAVGVEVASQLRLVIPGGAEEEARIRQFTSENNIYTGSDGVTPAALVRSWRGEAEPEVSFSVIVENLGNVAARPTGVVEVSNIWGSSVASLPVNAGQEGIFPGDHHSFTSAAWQPEGWSFGRYEAQLDLSYGELGRRTISAATSFWVIPLPVVIPLLLLLLAAVGAGFYAIRWYVSRQLRTAGGYSLPRSAAYQVSGPISKLTLMAAAALLFTIIFMIAVFLMFA